MGNVVPDNEENAKLCLCPGCPTYKQNNLSGTLFCGRGKAAPNIKAVGCLCPGCPVYKKYSLTQMYYCMQGKSLDI